MDDSAGSLLKWVIFILVILGAAWFFTGGPSRPTAWGGPFIKPLSPVDTGETYGDLSNPQDNLTGITIGKPTSAGSTGDNAATPVGTNSPLAGKIKIERGSASSAIQPTEEYIYLRNTGSGPINITGWTLKNSGVVQGGSGILRGAQRSAIIPSGVTVYESGINKPLEPIILQKGERAVVTTGKINNIGRYVITSSFKTNLCTGYLGRVEHYPVKPSLPNTCPSPEDEPGASALDDACFKVVKSLGHCHAPEIILDPETNEELVDSKAGIPSSCVDFIKLHYNYAGCLLFHRQDANFANGKEWRVFLGVLPLWAKDRETIYLYDSADRLVDSLSY